MTNFQTIVSVSIMSVFLLSAVYMSFKLKKTLQQDRIVPIDNTNVARILQLTKQYIIRKMQEVILQLTVYVTFVIIYTTTVKLEQPSLTIIRFTGAMLITTFIGKIVVIYAASSKIEKIKNLSSTDDKIRALDKFINEKHIHKAN